MILLLFINLILADYIPPLPCPVPEDRANAWLIKSQCWERYSCCFKEVINNISTSCCYAYGNDGPYKCCGTGEPEEGFSWLYFLWIIPGILLVLALALWYDLKCGRQ